MKRVYISGAITHDPGYLKKFNKADRELTSMGYGVINPAKVCRPLPTDLRHEEYMQVCLSGLLPLADTIYMLNDWEESEGAREEKEIAEAIGIKVIYQEKKEDTEF